MKGKIPYYVVKGGRGYWQPTRDMRQLGFMSVACGPDGPKAHAVAAKWNERWEAQSPPKGEALGPTVAPSRDVGFVYFLKTGRTVKIGFSRDPFSRVRGMSTSLADNVNWMFALKGTRAQEKQLHVRFAAYHQKGEWFRMGEPLERAIRRFLTLGRIDLGETENEHQLEARPISAVPSN